MRINQDEAGSRRVVEAQLGQLGKDGGARLLLDRCNGEPAERAYMRELAMLPRFGLGFGFGFGFGFGLTRTRTRTRTLTLTQGCAHRVRLLRCARRRVRAARSGAHRAPDDTVRPRPGCGPGYGAHPRAAERGGGLGRGLG